MELKFEAKNLKIFTNVNEFVETFTATDQHIKVLFFTVENYLAMLAENSEGILQLTISS